MGFNDTNAQARMLHRSIAYDGRFNSLTITEQWLYMRLLPFVDDEGKLTGDITELKLMTIPSTSFSDARMNTLLSGIEQTGLIRWDPGIVIKYTGWKKNQKIFHRPKKSKFPDPDIEETPFLQSRKIEKVLKDDERSEKVSKDANNIKEDKKKYKRIEDIGKEELSVLLLEFPDVNIQKALDGFKDYLLSSGKTYKNYLAALRNQCRKDWAPKYDKSVIRGNDLEYILQCPECGFAYKTEDKQLFMSCPKCRAKDSPEHHMMVSV